MRWAAVVAISLVAGGCGDTPDIHVTDLPPACAGDADALVQALSAAPAQVLVGGMPISRCFARGQDGADLQALGTSLLTAAQRLGDEAGDDPKSALELGYLVGAARRGAQRSPVGTELVRRVEGETGHLGANAADYRRGLKAGLAQG